MIEESALWAVFFLPLGSFVLIALVIRPFFNRYALLAGHVTILAVGVSAIISIAALANLASESYSTVFAPHSWLTVGNFDFGVGIILDSLTGVMLVVATLVSLDGPDILRRLHERRPRIRSVLRLHVALHGLDDRAGDLQ